MSKGFEYDLSTADVHAIMDNAIGTCNEADVLDLALDLCKLHVEVIDLNKEIDNWHRKFDEVVASKDAEIDDILKDNDFVRTVSKGVYMDNEELNKQNAHLILDKIELEDEYESLDAFASEEINSLLLQNDFLRGEMRSLDTSNNELLDENSVLKEEVRCLQLACDSYFDALVELA
jgi:hypothetical protein